MPIAPVRPETGKSGGATLRADPFTAEREIKAEPNAGGIVADTIFILLSIGLFYLAIRYVKWSDKV